MCNCSVVETFLKHEVKTLKITCGELYMGVDNVNSLPCPYEYLINPKMFRCASLAESPLPSFPGLL